MKLLTKSEQSKAKATEKQKEIQEGLKLAKKVDALREISAQEDKALKEFRKNTLAEIAKETLKESKKLDALKDEVKELEERKLEALKPLEAELRAIEDKTATLNELIANFNTRGEKIAKLEADVEKRVKEVSVQEIHVQTIKSQALDNFKESDTLVQEAVNNSRLAREVLDKAKQEAEELINNAEFKEKSIINREKAVFVKEEELRKKEIDLAKQESALKDKYETLERSIKRLKK